MKNSIFQTPRRGIMGNKPLGAEYMPAVIERARRLQVAVAIREPEKSTDNRLQRLPGF